MERTLLADEVYAEKCEVMYFVGSMSRDSSEKRIIFLKMLQERFDLGGKSAQTIERGWGD